MQRVGGLWAADQRRRDEGPGFAGWQGVGHDDLSGPEVRGGVARGAGCGPVARHRTVAQPGCDQTVTGGVCGEPSAAPVAERGRGRSGAWRPGRKAPPRHEAEPSSRQSRAASDRPPFGKRGPLAPCAVSLTFRRQAAALAFQNGPVVHKARRQPEITGGLSAPRADKGDDPTARFHRLRSARPDPPLSGRIGDLQNPACEIPQPEAMRQASGLMVFCGAKHIF